MGTSAASSYPFQNVRTEETISATDLRNIEFVNRRQVTLEMFHLIKFIITFRTFVVSLALMIEHVTLEKRHG